MPVRVRERQADGRCKVTGLRGNTSLPMPQSYISTRRKRAMQMDVVRCCVMHVDVTCHVCVHLHLVCCWLAGKLQLRERESGYSKGALLSLCPFSLSRNERVRDRPARNSSLPAARNCARIVPRCTNREQGTLIELTRREKLNINFIYRGLHA